MRIWLPVRIARRLAAGQTPAQAAPRRDRLQLALEVIAPGQTEIVERGRTQKAMGCPELPSVIYVEFPFPSTCSR